MVLLRAQLGSWVAAVCTFLLAIPTTVEGLVAFACISKAMMNGAFALVSAVTPESYPTVLRATGMAFASIMTRIASDVTMIATPQLPVTP